MEEIILKIRTNGIIERIPFPKGKTAEVFNGLTNLIGNHSMAFDDYQMDGLSSLVKEDVILLTDFFPEQDAGYNGVASFLLANTAGKRLPVWGEALLVKKVYIDPQDRFHFNLNGFSGISLDILEMYVFAAKNKLYDVPDLDTIWHENEKICEQEPVPVKKDPAFGRLMRQ